MDHRLEQTCGKIDGRRMERGSPLCPAAAAAAADADGEA